MNSGPPSSSSRLSIRAMESSRRSSGSCSRVGLRLGDLIVDGDDLYGDGVNVAFRLEREQLLAGPRRHSMIRSARTITDSAIDSPRDLAVLRFNTNSKVVGCSTGKVAGS